MCVLMLVLNQNPSHNNQLNFRELVEETVSQLEGAFALIFKSRHYPGEVVAARRGSPLLIGVRTADASNNNIPIFASNPKDRQAEASLHPGVKGTGVDAALDSNPSPTLNRTKSWDHYIDNGTSSEYFLASDASAVIEHTKRVLFLEDDDVAHIDVSLLLVCFGCMCWCFGVLVFSCWRLYWCLCV